MLDKVYHTVNKQREELLSAISGEKHNKILTAAKGTWNDYTPTKTRTTITGIDSSFNILKYQGLEFWISTVVSVNDTDEIIYDDDDCGLGKNFHYESIYPDITISKMVPKIANEMEITACEKSVYITDLVLMDGSLHSQFLAPKGIGDRLVELMNKRNNIVFVAKTSSTNQHFKGSPADIFYYNHITNKPGFSDVYVNERYGGKKKISYTFVRLVDSMPIIKLEFLGNNISKETIKDTMDKLLYKSLNGYPNPLIRAHELCKVSKQDIIKVASTIGGVLTTNIDAREVLN